MSFTIMIFHEFQFYESKSPSRHKSRRLHLESRQPHSHQHSRLCAAAASLLYIRENEIFTPFVLVLNSRLIQDHELMGSLSAKLDLEYPVDKFDLFSGSLTISDYQISNTRNKYRIKLFYIYYF